jgi:hypothetical protein
MLLPGKLERLTFAIISALVYYFKVVRQAFVGHNGKQSTVNKSLDGSMYPG